MTPVSKITGVIFYSTKRTDSHSVLDIVYTKSVNISLSIFVLFVFIFFTIRYCLDARCILSVMRNF